MKIIKILISTMFLFSFLSYTLKSGDLNVANGCIIQSDGNIVIAGNSFINGANQFLLARYISSTGALDLNFNNNGIVVNQIGSGAIATSLALQSNGYIIVAGYTFLNNQTQIALARFSNSGILDSTFGTNGIVTANAGDGATANSVALQSNGNIVIAGNVVVSGVPQVIISRYTTAGILDSSFGTNGSVITPLGSNPSANSLLIDVSGNIVIAGSSNGHVMIARYTSSGLPDSTFGNNGSTVTPIGRNDIVYGVEIQADGKLLVAGVTDNQAFVARYGASGVLDTNFGSGGVTILTGFISNFNDLAVQTDGNIVAVGSSDKMNLLLARFTTNGVLDSTYGVNGAVVIPQAAKCVANTISLQSNNSSIIAGCSGFDLLVSSVSNTGVIQNGFGNNGTVLNPTGNLSTNDFINNNYLFAYDTTQQQAIVANTFIDINFSNIGLTDYNWGHSLSTPGFTCNEAGVYELSFTANFSISSGSDNQDCTIIATLNGFEISGSQACVDPALSTSSAIAPVNKTLLFSAKQGDLLKLRFAGQNSKVSLLPNHALGITRPSISLTVCRVA